MTRKFAGRGHLCAGLVAAIGVVGMTGAPAIAQQAAEEAIEEIVVYAPVERRQRKWSKGGWVEVIELSRRVTFTDLDLSKYADVTELETRIETTAKGACEQLVEMFPLDKSDKDDVRRCTQKAIKGAEEQLQAAIAAAAPPR